MKDKTKLQKQRIGTLLLVIISLMISFGFAEYATRKLVPAKEFPHGTATWINFVDKQVFGTNHFDPEIGWIPFPNTLETDSEGNRLNGNPPLPEDGITILAIGDSYTWGSEVEFRHSWPAQLERELNIHVVNAGVGGYGLDQMLTRIKRSLVSQDPEVVIVAFITPDVDRITYKVRMGFNKPYYTIKDDGGLLLYPAVDNRFSGPSDWFKSISGYSYAFHVLMKLILPEYWLEGSGLDSQQSGIDKTALGNLLVTEIVKVVTADPKRKLLFALLPMAPEDVTLTSAPVNRHLEHLARTNDRVYVLNLLSSLRRMVPEPAERKALFRDTAQGYHGHFNERGNHFVAKILASLFTPEGEVNLDALKQTVTDYQPFQTIELVRDDKTFRTLRLERRYTLLSKSLGKIDFTKERLGDRDLWPYIVTGRNTDHLEEKIQKGGGKLSAYLFHPYGQGIVALNGVEPKRIGREFIGRASFPPYIYVSNNLDGQWAEWESFKDIKLIGDFCSYNLLSLDNLYIALSKSVGRIDFTKEKLGDRDLWPYILRGEKRPSLQRTIRSRGGNPARYLYRKYGSAVIAVRGINPMWIGREFFGRRILSPYIYIHQEERKVREFLRKQRACS